MKLFFSLIRKLFKRGESKSVFKICILYRLEFTVKVILTQVSLANTKSHRWWTEK